MVGVIPGPKELELTLNTFLQPLVDDLLQLWSGVEMKTYNNIPVIVRAALLCVGCDIPAARKVSGFLAVPDASYLFLLTILVKKLTTQILIEHYGRRGTMLRTDYLKNTKLAILKWKEWRLKRNMVLDTLVHFNYHTFMHHACV